MTAAKGLQVVRHGMAPYREGEALQHAYWQRRSEDQICDTLVLLEHPAVITLGVRKQSGEDVLLPREQLEQLGIELVQSDRGGLATLHSPGQIIGYFFVRLADIRGGLRPFIGMIEQGLIQACAEYGLKAEAGREEPGVWIGEKKIASLGLAIRRGISRHGFALNVCNDLSLFDALKPCGFAASVMTSLQEETGRSISSEELPPVLEKTYPPLLAAIYK